MIVAPSGVHHIAFRTSDVARLARFYVSMLGLKRESSHRDVDGLRAIWLRAGSTIVMIERRDADEPELSPASREALLFAIEASSRAAFEKRFARAKLPLDGETSFTLYLRDPEGRRVGVSHYPDPAPSTIAAKSPSRNTKTRRPKSSGSRGRRHA